MTRPHRIKPMAAWLLLTATLAAQSRQETKQVVVLANYMETAILRPASPQQERPFAVDEAEWVDITILSNSTTLEVTLIDPSGGLHPLGATDGIVRASYRGPSATPRARPSYEFELRNPPAGMWRYRVREPGSFADVRVVVFSMISSSDLVAALLGGGRDYPVNRPMTLGLVLAAEEGGRPLPAITSVLAEVQMGRDPAIPITFRDDGADNDAAAGDGAYTAEFTLRTPGAYAVRANVSGTRGGAPFQRTAIASFTAVSACGSLDRNFQSRPRDTNNNGRPDLLDVVANVNVTRAGKFQISAILTSSAGSQQASALVDLTAGSLRPATVPFPLTALRLLGNGPYQLSELRLGCVEGNQIRIVDELFDLGPTVPFSLAGAERGRIELSGANTERTVDTNSNRLFDRLEFNVGLDLLSAGSYQWSGALFDSKGVEIDFNSGSGNLAAGRATALVQFSGAKIGRNAVDGPYLVRNFLISGGGGSAVLPNIGSTLAYAYDTFEGAPARAAGPRISAGGTVDAASFRGTLVPGAIASLFGTNLAASTASASALPLPLELAGARVTVNGLDAPLFFVSPTQINFQIPFETRAGSAGVVVRRGASASPPAIVNVAANAPGVFTYERIAGTRDPIVLHASGSLVGPFDPARAGEVLIVFGTGIGELENAPPTGRAAPAQPLARARVNPTVTLGGVACESLFAGLTPGFVGLAQFNIRLPDRLPAGSSLPLIIRFGSASTQTVNLAVR
jgi:uncharacterized protein (TIGR03437 family)